IELTHFHAFVMGLVYLVLAHLVLATSAPDLVKRVAIVLAFVGLVGDLLGVWLIRYVSGAFAWAQLCFWIAQWVGFSAFVYYPLRELWCGEGRAAGAADGAGAGVGLRQPEGAPHARRHRAQVPPLQTSGGRAGGRHARRLDRGADALSATALPDSGQRS